MSKPLVGAPIGADVDGVYAGTTTNGENAPMQLGTTVNGIDGTTYVLVQAGASLMAATTSPNAVAIDEDYQAQLMTSTLAAAGHGLGFAPQAIIADNAFFWARVNGSNFNARVAASTAADAFLRTTLVAGRLSVTSTASAVAFPAVLVTAASASTSAGNSVREVLAGRLAAVRLGLASLP
jgi:hypothetical protein